MENQQKEIETFIKKEVKKEETESLQYFIKNFKKEEAEYWRKLVRNKGVVNFVYKKRNTM